MTYDVVAVVRGTPDVRSVLDGMVAAGEDLLVGQTGNGSVIQLFDADDRLLVSIEAPVQIQVPGEVERLLGVQEETIPLWWIEARATVRDGADRIARDFAERLVQRLGGTVWTSDDNVDAVFPEAT